MNKLWIAFLLMVVAVIIEGVNSMQPYGPQQMMPGQQQIPCGNLPALGAQCNQGMVMCQQQPQNPLCQQQVPMICEQARQLAQHCPHQ